MGDDRAGCGVGVAAGVVPVLVFAGAPGRGVGVARGAGVGVTGTVQSMMPLGWGTQFGSAMNGLWPPGTWMIWPPGPMLGAPAGGAVPFNHGLPASPGTVPPGEIMVFVFASYIV